MKKIISILFISIFTLASCGKTKYEELPVDKQETISKQVQEKIETKLAEIDMSDYTSEESLTPENLQKLREKMDSVVSSTIDEFKETEKDVDFTLLEERFKSDYTSDEKIKEEITK